MKLRTPEFKRVVAIASELTEGGRSQALRLRSDLVAEGQHATQQVATAVAELVDRNRQHGDTLRQTILGALQRPLGVLGVATKNDLAMERRIVSNRISTAVDELATLGRQDNDQLRETVQGALKHELSAFGDVARAIEELAAESRQHNDQLRETVQGAVKHELSAFGDVARAIEELAAESRQHSDQLRETVQGAMSREPNVLGLVVQAIEELAAQNHRLMTKDDLIALERRRAHLPTPDAQISPRTAPPT